MLNGEVGTGKTTFINQFIDAINFRDDMELFNNYNAYENNCYGNSYISFFAYIDKKIKSRKEFTNFIKSVSGTTGKGLVVVLYVINKSIFKKKFDIDVDDIKNKIKESMNTICKNKTQIFIIDELDCCKHNFAMETLEIVLCIKEFFCNSSR